MTKAPREPRLRVSFRLLKSDVEKLRHLQTHAGRRVRPVPLSQSEVIHEALHYLEREAALARGEEELKLAATAAHTIDRALRAKERALLNSAALALQQDRHSSTPVSPPGRRNPWGRKPSDPSP